MSLKSFFSSVISRVVSQGLSPCKGFLHLNVFGIFQVPQMRSEVAISDFQEFFEGIEVIPLIDHEDGHDAESDHIFESLIVDSLHLIDRIGNTSWIRRSHAKYQTLWPSKAGQSLEKMPQ